MHSRSGGASTLQRWEKSESSESASRPFEATRSSIRSWWVLSTDSEFLGLGEGRRVYWHYLLPIPSLVSMVFDWGDMSLLLLHVCAAAAFALAGWLLSDSRMKGILWSDVAVAGVHAAQVAVVCVLLSAEDGVGPTFLVPQVAATLAMVLAGVHTAVLAGFLALMGVASLLCSECSWQGQDAVICAYLLLVSVFVECRLAVLWSERQAFRCGYKPLESCAKSPWLSRSSMASGLQLPAELADYEPLYESFSGSAATSKAPTRAQSRTERWFGPEEPCRLPPACAANDEMLPLTTEEEDEVLQQLSPCGGRATSRSPSTLELDLGGPRAPLRQEELAVTLAAPSRVTSLQSFASRRRRPRGAPSDVMVVPAGSSGGRHPPSPSTASALPRAVILCGFQSPALNALYVERYDPRHLVSGRETYWSTGEGAGRHFLYFDAVSNAWAAAREDQLSTVQGGRHSAVAMAPPGQDIWDPSCLEGADARAASAAWREWDAKAEAWADRPQSGVQSRGRARHRDAPCDAAVQAAPSVVEKGCQTAKTAGEDILKQWTKGA